MRTIVSSFSSMRSLVGPSHPGIVPKRVPVSFLRQFSTQSALSPSGLTMAKVPTKHNSFLTEDYFRFLRSLMGEFAPQHVILMQQRARWQRAVDAGLPIDYRQDTRWIREDKDWTGPVIPEDLKRRWVEITGPAGDAKMVINALNSGANCYMTDLEDSQSPDWHGIIQSHVNIVQAAQGSLRFDKIGANGKIEKSYELNDKTATLIVRARGLHMEERHVVDESGRAMPATLFDIATFMYHSAANLMAQGKRPYIYMPKMQSYEEACLVHDMIQRCEENLGIPNGTVRVTALIETLPGLLQSEEILFGLGEYAAGLNCGRWDHIFSVMKTQAHNKQRQFSDRSLLTMDVPFLTNYMARIVQTCHQRGVHAMGGMSAFIPTKDADETALIMDKVKKDKQFEIQHGCDGAWVAHPGMVAAVQQVFAEGLGGKDNQITSPVHRSDNIPARSFLDVPDSLKTPEFYTEKGLRTNISVGIQYIAAWLSGVGAAAINNLMEDMATAEISRMQVWQWLHHGITMTFADGQVGVLTQERYEAIFADEVTLLSKNNQVPYAQKQLGTAISVFDKLVQDNQPLDFAQDIAYALLNADHKMPRTANQHYASYAFPQDVIDGLQGSRPDLDRNPIAMSKHRGDHLNTVLSTARKDGLAPHFSFLGTADGTAAVNVVAGGRGKVGPYSGGWQANAMRNRLQKSLPDTLWVSLEEPGWLGKEFNNYLANADRVQMRKYKDKLKSVENLPQAEREQAMSDLQQHMVDYYGTAVLADLEQGWYDPKKAFEATKICIENGITILHVEDQGPMKRCGHLGGKELAPLDDYLQVLKACNLAAQELLGPDQPKMQWIRFVARTDALSAERILYSKNLEDKQHPDHPFIDWDKGFSKDGKYLFLKKGMNSKTGNPLGLDHSVVRSAAAVEAGLASHVWMETPDANLKDAKIFLDSVNAFLAPLGKRAQGLYNHSPSFVWDLTFYIEAQELAEKVAHYVVSDLPGVGLEMAKFKLKRYIADNGDHWRGDYIFNDDHLEQMLRNGLDLVKEEGNWRAAVRQHIEAVRALDPSLVTYKLEQELTRIEALGYRPLRHITNIIVAQRLYNFRTVLADAGFNLHLVTLPQFHVVGYRMHELSRGMHDYGIHDYVKYVQRSERKHKEQTGNTYTHYTHQQATGTQVEANFFASIGSTDTGLLSGSTEAADEAKRAELEDRSGFGKK